MKARIGILTAVLVAACSSPSGDVAGILALDGDAMSGESHFSTCGLTTCHGRNGNVGDAPHLSSTVPDWSDEELAQIIKFGVGSMKSSDLDDQEIADLMAYLRQQYP